MKSPKSFWTIFDKINDICFILSSIALLLITVGVSADVISRYVFSRSFGGIVELTEFGLLLMTFLGIAWVWKKDTHVRIDILLNKLKPEHKTILNIIIALFGIVIFALLTWFGTTVTIKDFMLNVKIESVLKPLKWYIEIIIPIGCFLLFMESVRKFFKYIEVLKSRIP